MNSVNLDNIPIEQRSKETSGINNSLEYLQPIIPSYTSIALSPAISRRKKTKKKPSLFTHTQLFGQSAVCPIDGENPAKYQRRETESGVSEQFKRRKSFVLRRLIITKQVWRFLFFGTQSSLQQHIDIDLKK